MDDVRTPLKEPEGYHPWVVVRNYNEFVNWITNNGIPEIISFDHDLADEHIEDYYDQKLKNGWQNPSYDKFKEKTGLDCAKWLCEHSKKTNQPIFWVVVHSHNPVGATNIQSYINNYLKSMGWEQTATISKIPFKIETNGDSL